MDGTAPAVGGRSGQPVKESKMQPVRACSEESVSMPSVTIEPTRTQSVSVAESISRRSLSARLLCGRYQLDDVIGRGAMGTVYSAKDLRNGNPCAIKILSQNQDEDAYQRFVTEATVISQLFHPNIVEIREFRKDEAGAPFLVMELLSGVDLHSYLQYHQSVPLERTQEIIRQVASALHAIHSAGIVHRDVKAKNIFLAQKRNRDGSTQEEVKLVDFGLSKIIGHRNQQTAVGIILGTPEYLAPEATHGNSSMVDAAADQWSLAAVAYRMLSGHLPFETADGDVVKLLLHIRCMPAPKLQCVQPIPAYVSAAIERALSKNKSERFPSVLAFARAFCGHQMEHLSHEPSVPLTEVPFLIPRESTGPTALSVRGEQTQPIEPALLKGLIHQTCAEQAVSGGHSVRSLGMRSRWNVRGLVGALGFSLVLGLLFALGISHRGRHSHRLRLPAAPAPSLSEVAPLAKKTEDIAWQPVPVTPLLRKGAETGASTSLAPRPVTAAPSNRHKPAARSTSSATVGERASSSSISAASSIPSVPAAVISASTSVPVTTRLKPSPFQLAPVGEESALIPISQSRPQIPSSAWNLFRGEQLIRSYRVCVNVDGSILSAQVVQSTQNTQSIPMLDQIVTKHIMTTWRFRPIQGVQCFFQPFELTS